MKTRAYIVMALLINIALLTVLVPGRGRQKIAQAEPAALIASVTNKTEGLSLPIDNA